MKKRQRAGAVQDAGARVGGGGEGEAFWSALAERSGDGAFERAGAELKSNVFRACEKRRSTARSPNASRSLNAFDPCVASGRRLLWQRFGAGGNQCLSECLSCVRKRCRRSRSATAVQDTLARGLVGLMISMFF